MYKKNKFVKRTAAMLLALILTVGMIPGTILASEDMTAGAYTEQDETGAGKSVSVMPEVSASETVKNDPAQSDGAAGGVSEKADINSNTEQKSEAAADASSESGTGAAEVKEDLLAEKTSEKSLLAEAEEEVTSVYVTISDKGSVVKDKNGKQVSHALVELTGKESYTIDDVLKEAHEEYYRGGADAGYMSYTSDWGLSLGKLWGDESGAYGYYVNHASAWSLADPVTEGDLVYAYIYEDQTGWSDVYSWFDCEELEAVTGEAFKLTLYASGYDEDYNPVTTTMAGASITVNGKTTRQTTDVNGCVELEFDTPGTYTISARPTDGYTSMVPPVCTVTVADPVPVNEISVHVNMSYMGELVVLDNFLLTGKENYTIDDVLRLVDEEYALGGYEANASGWITMLMGDDSGAFGYYLNNQSAWSVYDEVKDGDSLYAYIYADPMFYSDVYTWFDQSEAEIDVTESLELTLTGSMYDSSWNLVDVPMEDCIITIDGEETEYVTDEDGKVEIEFDETGYYCVSAISDVYDLVPPVCMVEVVDHSQISVQVTMSAEGYVCIDDCFTLRGKESYTIDDVLRTVHEQYGMEDSYQVTETGWVTMLMGDDSGAFGYYLNNQSAWSVFDEVKDGDSLYAFIYADQVYYSDVYTWFDITEMWVDVDETVQLMLTGSMYDSDWNTVNVLMEDCYITIDDEVTEYVTDEDGCAAFAFLEEGDYVVSAISDTYDLIPPRCKVHVGQGSEEIDAPLLRRLNVLVDGEKTSLEPYFDPAIGSYTVTIPEDAEEITFLAAPEDADDVITYNGSEESVLAISDMSQVQITVTRGTGIYALSTMYTVKLVKAEAGEFRVVAIPGTAMVSVTDPDGKAAEQTEDGAFSGLFSVRDYTYTVSAPGYRSVTGIVPASGGTIKVMLEKAPASTLPEVEAEWDNFRGSEDNMAITDAKTPKSQKESELLWTKNFGSDYTQAPSVQILVDGAVVLMSGNQLIKLDKKTGDVLAQGTMSEAASYGYTSPIYAEGMIICPLSNGTIQAFSAKTLESLWIYKDPKGGQALTPITYANGCIYTGFWNGYSDDANFVCIPLTDEDPNEADEAKQAGWLHTEKGGYYWAGAAAIGDYLAVGSSDGASGTSGTSAIKVYEQKTGKPVSTLPLTGMGDVCSAISYADGSIYFTTQGGYLVKASVDASTGKLSDLKSVNSGKASTSTPVLYKNKIYYTNNKNFVCADADTMKILFTVEMKGYPQCSLLLSKAYESEGYLYFYSTYNNTPGGVDLIKVKTSAASAADAELISLYDAKGFENYCIASIICDADGTLYYKNDSCTVFAIAAKEVPKDPEDPGKEDGKDDKDDKKDEDKKDQTASGTTAGGIVIGNPETADTSVVVGGKAYSVRSEVADVLKEIQRLGGTEETSGSLTASLDSLSEKQIAEIVKAYKGYEALTMDEQIFVKAHSKLGVLTEAAGKANHKDGASGASVSGSNVPWYVKLILTEKQIDKDMVEQVAEALGADAEGLKFYEVSFYDILNETSWTPAGDISVRIPCPDKKGHLMTVIARRAADGSLILMNTEEDGEDLLFSSQEFGLCGIIGYDLTAVLYNEMIPEGAMTKGAEDAGEEQTGIPFLPIAAGVVLAAAGGWFFFLLGKRRKEDEE